MDKEEIRFIRNVIKAQDHLFKCLSSGDKPAEWATHYLLKFRKLYEDPATVSEQAAYSQEYAHN